MSSRERSNELGEPLYVDYMCNDELCYFYRCRTIENQVLVIKSLWLGKFYVNGIVTEIIRRRYSNKIASRVQQLRQLQAHPSVVRLNFSQHFFGPCSVTTEFHQSGNLFNWLAGQTHLTVWSVCQVIQYICVGLDYLHKNQIYHGNLGFRDILFKTDDPTSVAIVLDVSVRAELNKLCAPYVYNLQLCPPELLETVCELAEDLSPPGKKLYRTAKEIYWVDRLLRPTAERDMWCVGVIAHQLFTGKDPFFNLNLTEQRVCFQLPRTCRLTHPMLDTLSVGIQEQLKSFLNPDPLPRALAAEGALSTWFDDEKTKSDSRNLLFIVEYCFMQMEVSIYEDTIRALNYFKIR